MSQDTLCTITLGKQRSRNDGMKDIEQMTTNLQRRDIEKMG